MSRFASLPRLHASVVTTVALISPAAACGVQVGVIGEQESGDESASYSASGGTGTSSAGSHTSADTSSGTTDITGTDTEGSGEPVGLDVLFVVDNSGSMGDVQHEMAEAVSSMVDTLESQGVDYRLAFTTTDNGNPWCPGGNAEGGAFVFSSCIDRLEDFVNQAGTENVGELACSSFCTADSAALALADAGKPWIEKREGEVNISGNLPSAAACLLPQGINGCGFESPLESMYRALSRSEESTNPEFGFMRASANLLVVIITDEADCSFDPGWSSIFEQDAERTFWSDPTATFPTSAVCWNAGTACSGDPSDMNCVHANYDVDGGPVSAESGEAVLFPVDKYIDKLEEIRFYKRQERDSARVEVAVVAGYDIDGSLHYSQDADPLFLDDFGVGPGCGAEIQLGQTCEGDNDCAAVGAGACSPAGFCIASADAVPPVRLESVRAAGTTPYKISVCSRNWVDRFALIALEMSSD